MPRKVCFFSHLAARGVILTAQILRKQKIVNVSWCYIYVDHCLLHCVFTMRLWWTCFSGLELLGNAKYCGRLDVLLEDEK